MFRPQKIRLPGETFQQAIYRLAKAKDEARLTALLNSGFHIQSLSTSHQYDRVAMVLLASEGDIESVNFLIVKFNASRDVAVKGYAYGGHDRQVEDQLDAGASLEEAVVGYAMRGNVDKVTQYATNTSLRNAAIYGFARGGHVHLVNARLGAGGHRSDAAQGYAERGEVLLVNEQIAAGANKNYATYSYALTHYLSLARGLVATGASVYEIIEAAADRGDVTLVNVALKKCDPEGVFVLIDTLRERAAKGFDDGKYLENKMCLLRTMAHIDDDLLREMLVIKAIQKGKHPQEEKSAMFEKATKLNKIMHQYDLDYEQSFSLLVPHGREWLLQGQQLVKQKFSISLFLHISSFVLGCHEEDTHKIFIAVNKHLMKAATDSILSKFNNGLFSANRCYDETHRVIGNSKERLRDYDNLNHLSKRPKK